jgi:hypothetical protein
MDTTPIKKVIQIYVDGNVRIDKAFLEDAARQARLLGDDVQVHIRRRGFRDVLQQPDEFLSTEATKRFETNQKALNYYYSHRAEIAAKRKATRDMKKLASRAQEDADTLV